MNALALSSAKRETPKGRVRAAGVNLAHATNRFAVRMLVGCSVVALASTGSLARVREKAEIKDQIEQLDSGC